MKMKILCLLCLLTSFSLAGEFDRVKITPDMSYIYVYHKGKAVKVHRIQDSKNKLTGEYAKIYRPSKYIQPIVMHEDIRTVGEVEVLKFIKDKGNNKEGLLIDVRSKSAYKKESIPSAVNIPLKVINNTNKFHKVLVILGAKKKPNNEFDMSKVLDITLYCDGLWCNKSSRFIQILLDLGYPAEKILYYRGGFQMWKILGFTTVSN